MSRLVDLYPRSWRDRYGAEMTMLLADRPPTLRDRLDVVRGALDARLHPQLPGSARVPDRRGYAALVGFASLWLAVVIAANGPIHHDDIGTYRDGGAGLPFLILSTLLLSIGLYATVARLPADDRLSTLGGVVAMIAGPLWSAMPWVLVIGVVFLGGLLVLGVGARRAGLWTTSELAIVVLAAAFPAGLFLAQLGLPWYAMRASGLDFLVVIAPLSCIWLVAGIVAVRGGSDRRTT